MKTDHNCPHIFNEIAPQIIEFGGIFCNEHSTKCLKMNIHLLKYNHLFDGLGIVHKIMKILEYVKVNERNVVATLAQILNDYKIPTLTIRPIVFAFMFCILFYAQHGRFTNIPNKRPLK